MFSIFCLTALIFRTMQDISAKCKVNTNKPDFNLVSFTICAMFQYIAPNDDDQTPRRRWSYIFWPGQLLFLPLATTSCRAETLTQIDDIVVVTSLLNVSKEFLIWKGFLSIYLLFKVGVQIRDVCVASQTDLSISIIPSFTSHNSPT